MEEEYLSVAELTVRSRNSSVASINELVGEKEDQSLQRNAEYILLSKCEDEIFIANAYRYCSRCIGGSWTKCPPDQFSVQYLSGGLTNYLYLCSLPEDFNVLPNEPTKVLIRIHGEIVDHKQRFYEGVIFTLLSDRGFGPRNYGVFHSGRIEQFFPYRHLFTRELADPFISKLIAEKTANYHCMKLPLNKEPQFLWENFNKYLSMIRGVKFEDERLTKLYKSFQSRIDFVEEYEWLRLMLLQLNSPVIFCHNDLQEGNILYIKEEDTTDILLIDYDYSAYNYRGFDLGNHFCEWMYEYKDEFENGYKVYHDGYPTKEQQELFAKEYVIKLKEMNVKLEAGELDESKYVSSITISSAETILHEANRFALASHLFWFFWSIIQAKVSKIDFGFLEYAEARLDTYLEQKQSLGFPLLK